MCVGFGASLCPPSPKSQRYVYGGVPPVTLAVKLTLIPAEPSTNRVGGVTVRLTAAGVTFTNEKPDWTGVPTASFTFSQTVKFPPVLYMLTRVATVLLLPYPQY